MLEIKGLDGLRTLHCFGWEIIRTSLHPLSDEWYEIKLSKFVNGDMMVGSIRIHRIYSTNTFTYRCGVWLENTELLSFNTTKTHLSDRDEFVMFCVGELEKRVR